MDPIIALGAVGTALKIVDSLTGQWDRFFKNKASGGAQQPHRVQAEQVSSDTITVRSEGRPKDTITAADLARLPPNDLALIKALEQSMQRQYDLWITVYPTRDASVDPVVNAKLERQLKDIACKMCADLGQIFRFLDSLGKNLDDHYGSFRYICFQLENQAQGQAP